MKWKKLRKIKVIFDIENFRFRHFLTVRFKVSERQTKNYLSRIYSQLSLVFRTLPLMSCYRSKSSTGIMHVCNCAKVKPRNGILLPKLFWPAAIKNCSSDREKLLKFKAEGREFSKFLRSLEQFIQTMKGQNNFGKIILF